ncbi:MAG TPA: sec-independent translocase [Mycobacteriales bacterium]|nr:sec-independent translocase [Mycobacteriales bacterium]
MLNNLGWGELLTLLLLGLLVFGPEQLPKIAGDLGRMIRQLRRMATDVSTDLRSELGSEFDDVDLASLHPRKFIAKHLMADDDDDDYVPRTPRAKAAAGDGQVAGGSAGDGGAGGSAGGGSAVGARSISADDGAGPAGTSPPSAVPAAASDVVPPYDADAT